ncbi:hypothetical protein CsatB_001363 [Cannabis sativa]
MSTGPHLCRCDPPRVVEMKTSWTNKNPGRRFVRCPFHQQEQACNFWMWYDPPMCERALVVIPGLLRKIRNLEMEVSNLSEACNSKEGHESVENYINNKEQNECVESCHESTPTMVGYPNARQTCECQRSGNIRCFVICIAICMLFYFFKS